MFEASGIEGCAHIAFWQAGNTSARSEKPHLEKLVTLNSSLTNACLLKEYFRSVYHTALAPAQAAGRPAGLMCRGPLLRPASHLPDRPPHPLSCGVSDLGHRFLKIRAQSLQQN